jgi:redox-sensitive bicupin YhaK (pirin superfamily)
MTLSLQSQGRLALTVPAGHNLLLYVVRGSAQVNGQTVDEHHLPDFEHDDEQLEIVAQRDSMVLLCHALPLAEPIVARGPFVMNTKEEIVPAIADYQAGRFYS